MAKLGLQNTTDKISADYIGELKIGDFTVRCAVLSNEERVIFQKEFVGMLTGTKKGGLERYLQAKNLSPYLPDRFKGESWDLEILRFSYPKCTGFAHGFKAADIVDILDLMISINVELSHPYVVNSWGNARLIPYGFVGDILFFNNVRLDKVSNN